MTLGHKPVQRWNLPDGWVISRRPAHPALVSEDDFVAAQDINAARRPRTPQDEPVMRRYLLAGLLACGLCGRRMESAWSNGKAAHRCRHERDGAGPVAAEERLHPRGQAAAAPARPAPAAHQPRHARQAPHPSRRRRQEHREPGRGSRVLARARGHPHLEPGAAALQARATGTAKTVTVKAS